MTKKPLDLSVLQDNNVSTIFLDEKVVFSDTPDARYLVQHLMMSRKYGVSIFLRMGNRTPETQEEITQLLKTVDKRIRDLTEYVLILDDTGQDMVVDQMTQDVVHKFRTDNCDGCLTCTNMSHYEYRWVVSASTKVTPVLAKLLFGKGYKYLLCLAK